MSVDRRNGQRLTWSETGGSHATYKQKAMPYMPKQITPPPLLSSLLGHKALLPRISNQNGPGTDGARMSSGPQTKIGPMLGPHNNSERPDTRVGSHGWGRLRSNNGKTGRPTCDVSRRADRQTDMGCDRTCWYCTATFPGASGASFFKNTAAGRLMVVALQEGHASVICSSTFVAGERQACCPTSTTDRKHQTLADCMRVLTFADYMRVLTSPLLSLHSASPRPGRKISSREASIV
jgi:hypothetical protein